MGHRRRNVALMRPAVATPVTDRGEVDLASRHYRPGRAGEPDQRDGGDDRATSQ